MTQPDSIPVAKTVEVLIMRIEDQNGQQQVTWIAKDDSAAKLLSDAVRAAINNSVWNVLTLGTGTKSFSRSASVQFPHEPVNESEAVRDSEEPPSPAVGGRRS